jgi:hypothetical protein
MMRAETVATVVGIVFLVIVILALGGWVLTLLAIRRGARVDLVLTGPFRTGLQLHVEPRRSRDDGS